MELIDTHCHVDIERHFPDFETIVEEAHRLGVREMVLAGVHHAGWRRLLNVCAENSSLHAAPGLHPMYMAYHQDNHLFALSEIVKKK
jgi:TatD DNase family protein